MRWLDATRDFVGGFARGLTGDSQPAKRPADDAANAPRASKRRRTEPSSASDPFIHVEHASTPALNARQARTVDKALRAVLPGVDKVERWLVEASTSSPAPVDPRTIAPLPRRTPRPPPSQVSHHRRAPASLSLQEPSPPSARSAPTYASQRAAELQRIERNRIASLEAEVSRLKHELERTRFDQKRVHFETLSAPQSVRSTPAPPPAPPAPPLRIPVSSLLPRPLPRPQRPVDERSEVGSISTMGTPASMRRSASTTLPGADMEAFTRELKLAKLRKTVVEPKQPVRSSGEDVRIVVNHLMKRNLERRLSAGPSGSSATDMSVSPRPPVASTSTAPAPSTGIGRSLFGPADSMAALTSRGVGRAITTAAPTLNAGRQPIAAGAYDRQPIRDPSPVAPPTQPVPRSRQTSRDEDVPLRTGSSPFSKRPRTSELLTGPIRASTPGRNKRRRAASSDGTSATTNKENHAATAVADEAAPDVLDEPVLTASGIKRADPHRAVGYGLSPAKAPSLRRASSAQGDQGPPDGEWTVVG